MSTQINSLPLPPALRLLRIHHWIKSGFIAAPLFFTPSALNFTNSAVVMLGILAWSFIASFVYILNDWMDVEADRQHPTKCNRPLAAGTVSLRLAMGMMIGLVIAGGSLALWLNIDFALCLGIYALINLAYSFRLKHIAVVDVMCIALGFVLRVVAGAYLVGVETSAWIIILTGLLALFLGFAKRRDDIVKSLDGHHRKSLDGYNRVFIDTTLAIMLCASLVSYLIFTTDQAVIARLHTDKLFYTAPFVVYAMLRYLQLTMVKERSGSPVLIFLTDKPILAAGFGWVITFMWLIYA